MTHDLILMMVFLIIQTGFHNVHKIQSNKYLIKVSNNHYIVWCFHPVVIHSLQDYVVHIVVYSGRIVSGH